MGREPDKVQKPPRDVLRDAGGGELGLHPWQHANQGPDDATLVRFALWRATGEIGSASLAELEAGLSLMDSARSDLDSLETALIFTARAEGLTWARIAEAMGLGSPQAAQQRYQRTGARTPSSSLVDPESDADHV